MIEKNKKEYIESLAKIVRETFDIKSPVTKFKLQEIVEELGGDLEYKRDMIYDAKIERAGDKFLVLVNDTKPELGQIFSIARELGHLLLHMKRLDEDYWKNNIMEDSAYFRYGRGIEELESYEFAAAFLMPKEEFIDIYSKYRNDHIVANHFRVPSSVIYTRRNDLSY